MTALPATADASVLEVGARLAALLGSERVRTDRESLELFALDFSEERLATPAAIVEPASTVEVAAVARIAGAAGLSLIPRGGGMSYTLAAVPREARSVVVDLRRMNRLVELSAESRYVTVETGMSWAELRALDAFFRDNAELMQRHGIFETRLYIAVDHVFGIEPVLYWKDRPSAFRRGVASPSRRDALAAIAPNPEATTVALDLRRRMVRLFRQMSAVHHQIGKFYAFREALEGTSSWELLCELKALLDPQGRMNPGALGLG